MCGPAIAAFATQLVGGAGAAAATGATAAATTGASALTAGQMLMRAAAVMSVGGSLVQGAQTAAAAKYNAKALEQQSQNQMRLNAIEEQRQVRQYRRAMARQTAELAARGVSLSSGTAVDLARDGGREVSFAAQAIRSTGQAKIAELTSQQQAMQSRATSALWGGLTSAAGGLLNAAPTLWPSLSNDASVVDVIGRRS